MVYSGTSAEIMYNLSTVMVVGNNMALQSLPLTIELDIEQDGRWIADVIDLPGVLVYGFTFEEAIGKAKHLAAEVIREQQECGERPPNVILNFVIA